MTAGAAKTLTKKGAEGEKGAKIEGRDNSDGGALHIRLTRSASISATPPLSLGRCRNDATADADADGAHGAADNAADRRLICLN